MVSLICKLLLALAVRATCFRAVILICRDVLSAGVIFHGFCIPLIRRHHRIIPLYIRNALMLVFHIISLVPQF
jgi:hypothetical protein